MIPKSAATVFGSFAAFFLSKIMKEPIRATKGNKKLTEQLTAAKDLPKGGGGAPSETNWPRFDFKIRSNGRRNLGCGFWDQNVQKTTPKRPPKSPKKLSRQPTAAKD